ncbi:hypothetical protein BHE74_00054834, partial [Ensete ventricosum]
GKTHTARYNIGPAADRYMDQPLSGGTAKIDSRRSILAVDGRGRKRKKEEEEKKKKRRSTSRRPGVAREPTPLALL